MTGIISQEEFNFRIDRFLNTHYMGIDNNAIFYGYVNTTPNIYDYYNTMFKDLLESLFYMSKNIKYNKYATILEVVRYIKTDTGHGLRDCKHFYDYISTFINVYDNNDNNKLTEVIQILYDKNYDISYYKNLLDTKTLLTF